MVVEHNGIWTVPLSATHQPYQVTQLKRELPNHSDYQVVVVDTVKFVECLERGTPSLVVAEVGAWKEEKREAIRALLDPSTGAPYMARASIRLELQKRWFGMRKPIQVAVVSFTNGRHRTRYLQWAGASCIPIETHRTSAELLELYCACTC